jgi:hypothetical protein
VRVLVLVVVAAASLGGFLGGLVAHSREPARRAATKLSPPVSDDTVQPRRRLRDLDSHYLRTYRLGVVGIGGMTPLLLTPLKEVVPPSCPANFVVRQGAGTYQGDVLSYVEKLGMLAPRADKSGPLAKTVVQMLEWRWCALQDLAWGPVGSPPLRILVKHYPRADLPGRCYAVEVHLYTVPDPLFDRAQLDPKETRVRLRGNLITGRKTYQTDGGRPRIIEAALEVQTEVEARGARPDFWALLPDMDLRKKTQDPQASAHFEGYGGGLRHGLAWFDLSYGRGDVRPSGWAYRIHVLPGQDEPRLDKEPLDEPLAARLRDLVRRF